MVLAIVGPTFIVTANCGDSKAIVIGKDGSVLMETVDHKPDRPDERQRIEVQYKARVKRQIDLVKGAASVDAHDNTPYRVWAKDLDMPGLAMSRSIGDAMAKSLGVIADPEI